MAAKPKPEVLERVNYILDKWLVDNDDEDDDFYGYNTNYEIIIDNLNIKLLEYYATHDLTSWNFIIDLDFKWDWDRLSEVCPDEFILANPHLSWNCGMVMITRDLYTSNIKSNYDLYLIYSKLPWTYDQLKEYLTMDEIKLIPDIWISNCNIIGPDDDIPITIINLSGRIYIETSIKLNYIRIDRNNFIIIHRKSLLAEFPTLKKRISVESECSSS